MTKQIVDSDLDNDIKAEQTLTELVDNIYSVRDKLEVKYLAYILSKLADLENRVAQSTFGDVYYAGLVGIFKSYKKNW